MDWFLIGRSLQMMGEVMLGLSVILVHLRIIQERKIDGAVLHAMKNERVIAFAAIAFLIIGYLLELFALDYL